MDTKVVKITKNENDKEIYIQAGDVIKRGGLVAFPTETVYGLGANALDEEAAKKTYEAKGRPSDNPLIVHIADLEDLSEITENVPPETELLAKHFWPGPLTIVFPKFYRLDLCSALTLSAGRLYYSRLANSLLPLPRSFPLKQLMLRLDSMTWQIQPLLLALAPPDLRPPWSWSVMASTISLCWKRWMTLITWRVRSITVATAWILAVIAFFPSQIG